MNPELPSLKSVTTMIQCEEICRKVMNHKTHYGTGATRGYHVKTMPCSENFSFSMPKHVFYIKTSG